MEEKIVLGKKLETWMKYKETRETGYPEEIEEALETYRDHAGVRVKIQNPREALEAQIHEKHMGIRNPNKAIITPAAMCELESMIQALANQLFDDAGSLARVKTLREKGEGDVIITPKIVRLAYLDIISYSDDELVEEYNTEYENLIGVEE
ncbi:unknown [Methanobacterium phage psiM2]|uniref:Uncharacterized protein n=1 Tax=Methanobacterium phage psiM2 TaxID=77048 RepID=O80220_METM2|nr:hypothetical protein psiM2p32 [Methanobacterium phage psiM2]AAC27070.1 unknown [Methanobacterium phage psiM2]